MTPLEPTATLWLDLTDLEGWDGPVTGIQRVSIEHLRRFRALRGSDDPTVRGFVFRSGPDRFVAAEFEIDRNVVHVRVPGEESSPAQTSAANGGWRVALARTVDRFPAVGRTVRRVRDRVRRPAPVPSDAGVPAAPFAPGDTVVVLGGNWLSAGWSALLARVRSSTAVRIVHVVHDLIPVFAPQWAAPGGAALQGPYIDAVLRVADVVIAVSQATAADVERFVRDHRIVRPVGATTVVVHHGTELGAADGVSIAPFGIDPDEPFVLTVGTLEIRKNHLLLYQAYALAAERGVTLPRLYVVGRQGWLADSAVHLLTEDPVVAPQVTLLGPCDDAQLAWLYRHCRFSVYPSCAEGWGLPVGESVAHGKVCITCDRSSLPEVAGDCADYVSAFDPAALLDLMLRYCDDAVLHAREAQIRSEFRARSWDEAFADLRAAIGH